MIVSKAVEMAKMMNVPVLGLVENMSYVTCPDCGREIHVFGESHIDEVAAKYALPVLGKLPMEPKLAAACDRAPSSCSRALAGRRRRFDREPAPAGTVKPLTATADHSVVAVLVFFLGGSAWNWRNGYED